MRYSRYCIYVLYGWCQESDTLYQFIYLHAFTTFFLIFLYPLRFTLFPYTTLFRSYSIHLQYFVFLISLVSTHRLLTARCRSEEHTSELQSHSDLVCRLLLEKKKKTQKKFIIYNYKYHKKNYQ